MKALLLHVACPERQARLIELATLAVDWHVAEPRWPHFRHQIDAVRPDFVVIDLGRSASHGLEAASYLQNAGPYRHLPLFVMNPSEPCRHRLSARKLKVTVATPQTLLDYPRSGGNRRAVVFLVFLSG